MDGGEAMEGDIFGDGVVDECTDVTVRSLVCCFGDVGFKKGVVDGCVGEEEDGGEYIGGDNESAVAEGGNSSVRAEAHCWTGWESSSAGAYCCILYWVKDGEL